jgi:hypothetical protein
MQRSSDMEVRAKILVPMESCAKVVCKDCGVSIRAENGRRFSGVCRRRSLAEVSKRNEAKNSLELFREKRRPPSLKVKVELELERKT